MRLEILRTAIPDPKLADVCAIGIMIKAPRSGASKTRLSPPLTPAEAADISRCFLRDTASSIATLARMNPRVSGIAVYTPVGSEEEFSELLPSDFKLIPQRAEGFGERLSGAVEDLFSAGYGAVCLLDSDSPNLPLAVLENLVTTLFEFQDKVVVGPCVDGGYYAIGLRRPHRCVFEEIAWSTDQVYRETLERAAEINLPVTTLPVWYDIDDETSLQQLLVDLFEAPPNNETSLMAGAAPATKAFLQRILQAEGGDRIWPGRLVASEPGSAAGSTHLQARGGDRSG
jgi:uncharacterized protein